jgi:DNA-binding NtrC family response regulator
MVPNTQKYILIVDDQENWRNVIKSVLADEQYCISEADNAETAKEILAKTPCDLAVLDVRLQDEQTFNVEGLDLVKSVKAQNPAAKVIVLTGYPESIKDKSGPDLILHKVPSNSTFNPAQFKKHVEELLKKN